LQSHKSKNPDPQESAKTRFQGISSENYSGKGWRGTQDQQNLGASCNYWSMGVIGYKIMMEKTPFHSFMARVSKITDIGLSVCEKYKENY
jgi:hypothetical protein